MYDLYQAGTLAKYITTSMQAIDVTIATTLAIEHAIYVIFNFLENEEMKKQIKSFMDNEAKDITQKHTAQLVNSILDAEKNVQYIYAMPAINHTILM